MTQPASHTCLITGAAKRIGRSLALGLAKQGWNIAIHYSQSKADAESLCKEIEALGQKALLLQADLSSSDATAELITKTRAALGPINLLINNASLFERDTIDTLELASWDAHLNTNLRAPALLMRDFAAQAAAGDSIINIIDQRVWRLTPDFISYTVSKSGLWTLTQTFAQALAPRGIRVNAIGPGPTLPNPRQDQAEFEKQTKLVPLGVGAAPEDIFNAVQYLLTAHAVTGQMLAVDGGQHLAWQTPDVTQVKE